MTARQSSTLKKRFLEAFSKHGVVSRACRSVGLNRSLHYTWLERDKKYLAAYIQADAEFTESLIDEAITRGRDGKVKPVIWQGKAAGRYVDIAGATVREDDPDFAIKAKSFVPLNVQEYSDRLLMFLIKARKPEYRESFKEIAPPPTDGKSADDWFSEIDARAKAAAAPKPIEEAQIREPNLNMPATARASDERWQARVCRRR